MTNGYEPRQAYEHLVVPLDGSAEADRAVTLARQMADSTGARLHLLHIESESDSSASVAAGLQQAAARLGAEVAVRPMKGGDIPAGMAVDAYLRELGNATAVMATHGRGRLASALMGSVTTKVISLGNAVVALGPNVAAAPAAPSRVLACVDATSFGEQVVSEAAGWAKALGVPLWMVEVVAPSIDAPKLGGESGYVHRLAGDVKASGISLEWEVLHDDKPARAIVEFAAAMPGTMVALATHGRSGLRRALMGSVAGDVLKAANFPVVVVQPGN